MILLGEVIERNESLYPHAVHSVYGERRVTFKQFAERARRLASGLHRLGLRHQDRVAILAMNCTEFVEVYGAGELSGFIVAPVNWRLAPAEIAYVLKDAAPKTLIFEQQYAELISRLKPELSGIESYICIGDKAPEWAIGYEEFLTSGDTAGAPLRAAADDILCLIYTSGTTGRPKGCMLTHRNHAFMAEQSAGYQGIIAGDRTLVIAPLFHVGARSQQLPTHLRGASVVIHRGFEPLEVLRTIERERITHLHMVPTMVQGVLEVPGGDAIDTSSLKCIIYAAAPMPVPVLRRAIDRFGKILVNGWGLTEGGNGSMLPAHLHRPDGTPQEVKRLGSVGQATVGTKVRVADDAGKELPRGEIGELLLSSISNMVGYWNNHPATFQALREGWLHTGDMGYMDEEGYIFLVDRKKDMIISGGENIYCREVESALIEHPGLADVAVIGVADAKWGEAVKAVAVRAPGSSVTDRELIDFCKQRIASYKCPKSIDFVEQLPRLPSGKVSKVELRKAYEQGASTGPQKELGNGSEFSTS